MNIRILNNSQTKAMLQRCSVPNEVAREIMGQTFNVDPTQGTFKVSFPFVGVQTEWSIPAECVEQLET